MSVKILNEIDISEYSWCKSAVMFRVWNGIGTITHRFGKKDENYCYNKHLLINGKPILQENKPICPTCAGMLATGYGIENIDCPELKAVSECLNSNYINIMHSAEMLKPLLNLLEDGYYLLADVPHYPTDGHDTFFWSVPNELVYNNAFCDEYYNPDFCRQIMGFPQYLYPTQSADMYSEKRINEYIEIFKNNPAPPRALAYHKYGFISALLDGHHKATASAILGQQVNCLTIISIGGCSFGRGVKYVNNGIEIDSVWFSGIRVTVPEGSLYGEYFPYHDKKPVEDLEITEYNLTGRSFPEAEKNISMLYPDIEALTAMYSAELEKCDFTDETIDDLIANEDFDELKYALCYLMITDKERAYRTAVKIVKNNSLWLPLEKAWKVLLNFKDEQTEKLFIEHIVEYGNKSSFYDIVTSYWD
ncbi:MAG: hypothetical protein NC177_15490 [Ruminococcus flavefaciens]|nr:hypothetical protein [Ruminococcus flavefaciens]